MDKKQELRHYKALIYYSGYVEIDCVDCASEDAALEYACLRVQEMSSGRLSREIEPTLERWEEADTVEEIENE